MLYNDTEKELMANAIQVNMRTSSASVHKGISAIQTHRFSWIAHPGYWSWPM